MSYRSYHQAPATLQVIDLFAGPGGLAEGFSACRDIGGHQPFNIVLSVEKERAAHSTLRLRSFLRQFDEELPPEYYIFLNEGGAQPDWARAYPEEWSNACEEALCAELGTPSGNALIRKRLDKLKRVDAPRVVIGGPPCQAYSLVGRARNRGKADYVPEHDHRHFLYQEYIGILEQVQPEAFVMENVKGMLSSSIEGDRIFERVLADLRCAGGSPGSYELFAIKTDPKGRMTFRKPSVNADFLLLSEQFGIPQARHRVIIVGLRRDIALRASFEASSAAPPEPATLRHVLAEMPPLRSGLSVGDSEENWRNVVVAQMRRVCSAISANDKQMDWDLLRAARTAMATFRDSPAGLRCSENMASSVHDDCPVVLRDWLIDPLLSGTANHATRRHMADDLARYFFCSVFAQVFGRAPKSREFPPLLAPTHASWTSGAFADRFRSQPWEAPATTITSHISKDGHYFIHPDPLQCRSLTVREAARIQTFPDNYLFLGNRTEQYVQVGNAVPPFLANQIAQTLWSALSPALITKQDGAGPSTPVLA